MLLRYTSHTIFLPWTLHSFEHSIQFVHVLALYDPFGVDVLLNFDITQSIIPISSKLHFFAMQNFESKFFPAHNY